jgi:asparagine synthase (glutamine-hydrolysing)
MSGFVALLHTDGAPVDPALLQTLTDTLAFRGPDGLHTWHAGAIGLGHAMLRTTDAQHAAREQQPCTLDGQVWITADARVDDRDTLRRALAAAGRADAHAQHATDPQLILHAYHAWGDECMQHLLGDFSFVIWDAPRRRLFCAAHPR